MHKTSNKNISPVVFVLLDAFRWDYLNQHNTPTLWTLSQSGLYVQKLKPSFGFCEITEYATGARPNVSGKLTQLTVGHQRHATMRFASTWLESLEKQIKTYHGRGSTRLYQAFVQYLVKPILQDGRVWNLRYNIPLHVLPFLKAVEADTYQRSGAFGIPSFFETMHRSHLRIHDQNFVNFSKVSGSDENRVQQLENLPSLEHDLYMIYLGECDGTGHLCGPISTEMDQATARIDRYVHRLREAFCTHNAQTRFLIVGDHGMLPVSKSLDAPHLIEQTARQNGLIPCRDYLAFYDSTMVRLWFYTHRAKQQLTPLFNQPPFTKLGTCLTEENAHDMHVPAPGNDYGHLIWYSNPETVVFPDYFNRDLPKGMHGYPTHIDEQKGMAILSGSGVLPAQKAEAELIDLCPTICDLFGISYPENNHGTSLLTAKTP